MILPADKGKATVILDSNAYKEKIDDLLADNNTYTPLKGNPTSKYLNRLVNILRDWKKKKIISDRLYWQLYPSSEDPPKLYGSPKIHKPGTPLRPIVSSCGSITYAAAKYLARVLRPLRGNTIHSAANSQDVVDKLKDLEVPPGNKLVSFDVSALFTSVPTDRALTIIRQRLSDDPSLSDRTELSVDQLCQLLSFCLNTTYFQCNGQFYQQCHGAAMGSPVSPIIADIYMEDFEQLALESAPHPPSTWLRYVDDTFIVIHEYHLDSFFNHINSIDRHIQFTMETEIDGKLPFLDLCIHVNDDGSTRFTIYRKPTHTDQYLNFQSNHPIQHKRSVVRTLINRAEQYITMESDRSEEMSHIRRALQANDYKPWAMTVPKNRPQRNQEDGEDKRPLVAIPYIKNVSEQLARIYRSHGVNTYYKPYNTIREKLVHPKDPTPDNKKSCVIYELCCREDPSHTYIGETKRTLATRVKEHQKLDRPTAVGEHTLETGHTIDPNKTKILARETHWYSRKCREALQIKSRRPILNRDQGLQLPLVYNPLLEIGQPDAGKSRTPFCDQDP